MVTCELGYSRAAAGAPGVLKDAAGPALGHEPLPAGTSGLPETLVWDREGAIHAGKGEPTEDFAAFCDQLPIGWRILRARDPESKGALQRTHRFMRSNFESARSFCQSPGLSKPSSIAGFQSALASAFTAASVLSPQSVLKRSGARGARWPSDYRRARSDA